MVLFFLGPFHSGQSLTVANALRRTLLSELKGLAITSAEIQGAVHEYSILPGVRESVLDILLNLKEIVLKASKDSSVNFKKTQVAFIQVRGPGVVRAKDIKLPIGLQCVDPEQYIATLGEDGVLNIQLKIQQGKNYTIQKPSTFLRPTNWKELHLRQLLFRKLSEMKQNSNSTHSASKPLSIDAVFMPITKVNYTIQVEDNLSIALEKTFQNANSFDVQKQQAATTPKSIREKTNHIIVLDIWTNGSIHPREALYLASNKLLKLFATIEKNSNS